MLLTLKNGVRLKLSWNLLCLEYAEEYSGGINQLQKDLDSGVHPVKTMNTLIAAVVRGNSNKLLTREEALSLVNYTDYEDILNFINKESEELNLYKKKQTSYPHQKKKKRK